jgi:hypothetical protein
VAGGSRLGDCRCPLGHCLADVVSTLTEQLAHKTIVRVQENASNPVSGWPSESRIILHFADGTGLELAGSGDDCDEWIEAEVLDAAAISERRLAERRYEADQQVKAIERKEWLALTCEERCKVLKERAEPGPGMLMTSAFMDGLVEEIQRGSLLIDTPERTIAVPCTKCHERECENATTKTLPAQKGIDLAGPWTAVL